MGTDERVVCHVIGHQRNMPQLRENLPLWHWVLRAIRRTALRNLVAGAAVILLAACGSAGEENDAAAANPSGNVSSAAQDKKVQYSSSTSLEKEQALVLMEQRKKNFKKIGGAMKVISRELKGQSPNLNHLRTGAATIAQFAPQVPAWFPAGTGPDVGKTGARAEVWQKPEGFAAKSQAFREAAVTFNTAVQGSDFGSIRSVYATLGKSCKGCHDVYRAEE